MPFLTLQGSLGGLDILACLFWFPLAWSLFLGKIPVNMEAFELHGFSSAGHGSLTSIQALWKLIVDFSFMYA